MSAGNLKTLRLDVHNINSFAHSRYLGGERYPEFLEALREGSRKCPSTVQKSIHIFSADKLSKRDAGVIEEIRLARAET